MCVHPFSFMRAGTPCLWDLKCCPGLQSFDLLSFFLHYPRHFLGKICLLSFSSTTPPAWPPTLPTLPCPGHGCDAPAHTGLQRHERGQEVRALRALGVLCLISSNTGNPRPPEQIQKWYLSALVNIPIVLVDQFLLQRNVNILTLYQDQLVHCENKMQKWAPTFGLYPGDLSHF